MTESSENLNIQAIELASRGEYTEAIACYKRAITIDRENYLLWYNLGITYRDAGNLKLAREALIYSHSLEDTNEEVLETLAVICLTMEEFEAAFSYCAEALELNPDNAHVWNIIGVVYFSKGEYEQAASAFEQAVSLYPHYHDALFNLRDTYQELKNKKGVQECDIKLKQISGKGITHA
ncbi:MAG: tetratricopeptide repeat protein [Bacteroides sp.]|nr:tetratricopeptide repeat protein [Prevotella sp.]MCM1408433.1 tetratricopeptide repeat protein [Treponema brennaborense]MCM1469405.1 tetratricopeptide repeat protein [Bacteroides sp.]